MYNVEEKCINELKLRAVEKTPFYEMNCDSYDICIYVRAQAAQAAQASLLPRRRYKPREQVPLNENVAT